MLLPAIELALLYALLNVLELALLGWQAFTRPIVICPLAGALLGDMTTGCMLGASLESLFMGISAIGGSIPSDWISTSFIATAYVVLTGSSIESAIAIAMPLGTVMGLTQTLPMVILSSFQPYVTKLIQDHKVKTFEIVTFLMSIFNQVLNGVVVFLAIYIGVDALQGLVAMAPAWVMSGLGAVSSMVMAVGFAILASQIITGEIVIWFFVGYVLVKYLALDTLAVALLVGAAAVAIFFIEKKIAESKLAASSESVNDEEDFF